MILYYVANVLSISDDPDVSLRGLQSTFKLKDDKFEEPDEMYLGVQLRKCKMRAGNAGQCPPINMYPLLLRSNVLEEAFLKRKGLRLPSKCYTALPNGYLPELETLAELKANGVQFYQEMIGVLRWAVELPWTS